MTKQEVIKKILSGEIEMVNCTPHPLTWVKPEGTTVTISPSGIIPRVNKIETDLGNGFVTTVDGEIEGLPAPSAEKIFIVSGMVFSATNRGDVIAPNTNREIRNENGQIIGVPGFIMQD